MHGLISTSWIFYEPRLCCLLSWPNLALCYPCQSITLGNIKSLGWSFTLAMLDFTSVKALLITSSLLVEFCSSHIRLYLHQSFTDSIRFLGQSFVLAILELVFVGASPTTSYFLADTVAWLINIYWAILELFTLIAICFAWLILAQSRLYQSPFNMNKVLGWSCILLMLNLLHYICFDRRKCLSLDFLCNPSMLVMTPKWSQ